MPSLFLLGVPEAVNSNSNANSSSTTIPPTMPIATTMPKAADPSEEDIKTLYNKINDLVSNDGYLLENAPNAIALAPLRCLALPTTQQQRQQMPDAIGNNSNDK